MPLTPVVAACGRSGAVCPPPVAADVGTAPTPKNPYPPTKPKNHAELARVEKNRGFVRAGRVDGELAVSRGFGDFCFKDRSSIISSTSTSRGGTRHAIGDNKNKNKVTAHPDILVQTREPTRDEFVVLACDGIWDVLENRDCADLVSVLAHEEGESDVGLVCEEILDTGLELDSRDNMTCCVVMFPGSRNSLAPSGSGHGVLKRRMDRMKSRELSIARESERLDSELKVKAKRLEERKRSQLESVSRTRSTMPGESSGTVQRPPIVQERKRSEEGRDSPLGHNDNEGKKFKASTSKTSADRSMSLKARIPLPTPPRQLSRLPHLLPHRLPDHAEKGPPRIGPQRGGRRRNRQVDRPPHVPAQEAPEARFHRHHGRFQRRRLQSRRVLRDARAQGRSAAVSLRQHPHQNRAVPPGVLHRRRRRLGREGHPGGPTPSSRTFPGAQREGRPSRNAVAYAG